MTGVDGYLCLSSCKSADSCDQQAGESNSQKPSPSIVRWKSRSPDKPALTPTSLSSTDRNQSPDKVGGKKPITARLLCPLPESTTVVISFSSVDSKLCFPRSVIATALRLWRFSLPSTIPLNNEVHLSIAEHLGSLQLAYTSSMSINSSISTIAAIARCDKVLAVSTMLNPERTLNEP